MNRWMAIFFAVLSSAYSAAQVKSFTFRNISINEGLSQSSVVDIAIDNTGFIWLATQDGLNRFDGKEFIIFQKNFDDITTPAGNRLGKIIPSGNNKLWLITSNGRLEKFDLYTQTFLSQKLRGKNGLPLSRITCLYEDGDEMLIGTENQGLFYYRNSTTYLSNFTTSSSLRLSSNAIQHIFRDSQKQFWILTNNGVTLIRNDLSAFQTFLTAKNSNESVRCSSITEDDNNTIWLGSFGKGLYVKRRTDTIFSVFKGFRDPNIFPTDLVIETVFADRENRLWAGTYGNGVFIINTRDSLIHHILSDKKNPFSIGYNDVLSIKQDKRGGIWIGTDGGGVSYYDKRLSNFETFSKNNLEENISIEQVRSVTTDQQDNIWVGTSNSGLTFIDKDQKAVETIRFLPSHKNIASYKRIVSLLTDSENDIWVGTQGNGLLILNSQTKKIKKAFHSEASGADYLPDHTIWCLLPQSNGKVWAGTRNAGLCLVDKQKGLIKHFNDSTGGVNSLPENNIRTLTAINDSILCLGFENKGIRFFNTYNYSLSPVSEAVKNIFTGETVIRSSYYKQPILWIGTFGKGLMAFDLHSGKVNIITDQQGLPNNTIYGIQPDKTGRLWLSTNKGISRFSVPADLNTVNRSHFINFTASDGLQSNEFNTGAHYRSPNGKLFFGGIKGLTVFDPLQLTKADRSTAVVITQAFVDNQPLQSDTLISHKKLLQLNYNQNSLSFNFAALDIISAGQLNYYYQMMGYDKDWIDAGERNYAAYTNLPPGKYTFRAKASRYSFGINDPVTSLAIVITPPFWKTGWFIASMAILLIGILYVLYRYRIAQIIRLQKVRNRIATDLHDDIGSTLTNISILSELSRKNISQAQGATVFLDRISEEVYNSSQALDDIVWSINTDNDSLEQTVARMRRYASEIFDGSDISYSLHFDEKFSHQKLDMEQRRDFFLLFKEAIANIYKHAKSKNVNIETGIYKNMLYMQIQDNGKGFDTTALTHRNGIKNMQERVKKWNGNFRIESMPGKGTFIRFDLSLA